MNIIKARQLVHEYIRRDEEGNVESIQTALNHVDIDVKAGQFIAVLGHNGSGKSTILKTVTKHLAAISGTVCIGRDELGKMSYQELSKKVAVVLTERIKPELMTCRDVVTAGRYPYTGKMGLLTAQDEQKITEAMEKVRALELSEKSFDAISDGQKQRIMLARAICQEPEIIVLDEPTSFLDIRHKIELLNILKDMARTQGTTVVMSLHEIELAYKMSDRIICVKGDYIEHFGTVEEVFQEDLIKELFDLDEETFRMYFQSIRFYQ